MSNPTISSSSSSIPPIPIPLVLEDDGALLDWNRVKKIAMIALKVICLGALALFQMPIFVLGFTIGFIAKIVAKKWCSKAGDKIQAAIAKRPWLFTGIVVVGTIFMPEWLLVGPPLIGGIYSGIKVAKWFQK